jgi:hypothetical protein
MCRLLDWSFDYSALVQAPFAIAKKTNDAQGIGRRVVRELARII